MVLLNVSSRGLLASPHPGENYKPVEKSLKAAILIYFYGSDLVRFCDASTGNGEA